MAMSRADTRLPVKFCGMTRIDGLRAALAANVRAVGFNLYPKSKRFISADAVQTMLSVLAADDRRRIDGWLVVVNPTLSDVIKALKTTGADVIQLHGDEPPVFASDLRRALSDTGITARIVKALKADESVIERAESYLGSVDGFLLDANIVGEYGGTGAAADQQTAVSFFRRFPDAGLAGGLTPENVGSMINATSPAFVDVASGIEINGQPGNKSQEKMKRFADAVARAMGRSSLSQ